MTRLLRLCLQRLLSAVPTLLLVAVGAFVLIELAPGDAVDAYLAETGGDAGFAAEMRRRLGLSGSPMERLGGFLVGLLSLDLGKSLVFNRPVFAVVFERLPNTLLLMGTSLALAAGIGLSLGLVAGARPGSVQDRSLSATGFLLLAIPNFWLALVLILAFVVQVPLFPIGGLSTIGRPPSILDTAMHLVLPTIALGAGYIALYLRTLRAGMIDAWPMDHVRSARARGLPERRVVLGAVARPALLPTIVVLGQNAGTLVGGSIVIETVFAIPGTGRLAFEAVMGRDTAMLAAVVLTSTVLVIAINLAVDLLLAKLDPRIGARHG